MSALLNEAQKRELVRSLIETGAPADQAEVAVDLALHAIEEAVQTFGDKIKAAPSPAAGLAAFQIGTQLAQVRFAGMAENCVTLQATLGLAANVVDLSTFAGRAAS